MDVGQRLIQLDKHSVIECVTSSIPGTLTELYDANAQRLYLRFELIGGASVSLMPITNATNVNGFRLTAANPILELYIEKHRKLVTQRWTGISLGASSDVTFTEILRR